MDNLYDILGVTEDAPQDEIKAHFRRLAKVEHPDKGGSGYMFADVLRAYRCLGDCERRSEYDALWQAFSKPNPRQPIHDEVNIEEFIKREINDGADGVTDMEFLATCQCGDSYKLSSVEYDCRVGLVFCPGCSLCVQIDYNERM